MRIAVAGGTGAIGSHVVGAARRAGHDTVVLARSAGVDLRRDDGLSAALEGVDVLVDATNAPTTGRARATAFFTDVTARLQRRGAAQGVSRLVTVSIVGIDRVPSGYYRAKLAQEAAARRGPLPATVVRATQCFEFPSQVLARTRLGPVAVVPAMLVQPVAARSLAEVLVAVATRPPEDGFLEVAGPGQARLADLARRVLEHRRRRVRVVVLPLPGTAGRAMRRGGLLPAAGARVVGPTFAEWLEGPDAGVPSERD